MRVCQEVSTGLVAFVLQEKGELKRQEMKALEKKAVTDILGRKLHVDHIEHLKLWFPPSNMCHTQNSQLFY